MAIFDKLNLNKKENEKILIIDGTNSLIRTHAIAESRHLNGYFLFLKEICNLTKLFLPNYVYIVFDGQRGSIKRKLLYKQYKQHRNVQKNKHNVSMDNINEILIHLPIIVLSIDGIQADDTISHIVKTNKDKQIIISSADKDFYQLISDRVIIWHPSKKQKYTVQRVKRQYNVHPINFPIYKSIIGDASDNIPGIKGIGRKTLMSHIKDLFLQVQPINGDINIFYQYIKNNKDFIDCDFRLKIIENQSLLKIFYKIINLIDGIMLSPAIGMELIKIIQCKLKNLNCDSKTFFKKLLDLGFKRDQINDISPLVYISRRQLKEHI